MNDEKITLLIWETNEGITKLEMLNKLDLECFRDYIHKSNDGIILKEELI